MADYIYLESEVFNQFILAKEEEVKNYTDEFWKNFWNENITQLEKNDIEIKMSYVVNIFRRTFKNIKLLLCGISAIQNPNSNILKKKYVTKIMKGLNPFFEPGAVLDLNFYNTVLFFLTQMRNLEAEDEIFKYFAFLSVPAQQFVNRLGKMILASVRRLDILAPKEVAKEHYLYKMWCENNKFKREIDLLEEEVMKITLNAEENWINSEEKIVQKKGVLDDLKSMISQDVVLVVQKNESQMVRLTKKSKNHHMELEQINEIASTNLQALGDNNLGAMKAMLDKKLKREVNLNSWVKKYDTDVSVKWEALEKLKEELEEHRETSKKHEDNLEEQSVPYNIYREILRLERLEQLEISALNLYASKIQTWWRFIVKTKLRKKKKGKRGKRGKSKTKKN